MEKTKKSRAPLLFWGAVVLVAAVCAAAMFFRTGNGVVRGNVRIYVADELYAVYPVSVPRTVTVEGDDGKVNVIKIDGSGVVMASSTCTNQICVNTGRISAESGEMFDLDNWIVCLPNRVSIELSEEE